MQKKHKSNLFPLLLLGSVDAVYTARVEDVLPEKINVEGTCFRGTNDWSTQERPNYVNSCFLIELEAATFFYQAKKKTGTLPEVWRPGWCPSHCQLPPPAAWIKKAPKRKSHKHFLVFLSANWLQKGSFLAPPSGALVVSQFQDPASPVPSAYSFGCSNLL